MDETTLPIEDEFEEIDGDEVDGVVESLEILAQTVSSDSLRAILEDAADEIHELYYKDDSDNEAA